MTKYSWIGHRMAHRVIMEKHIGRKLSTKEAVHHKNGIGTDNIIKNLQLMSMQEHSKYHGKLRENYIWLKCSSCNKKIKRAYSRRPVPTRNKSGKVYCNKSCQGKDAPHNNINYHTIGEENIRNILKLKEQGMTGYRIAKKLGLNNKTVYNYMAR